MKRNKGKFIVIDGCEGAGKSTMLDTLKTFLKEGTFILTREPGGTPLAEEIRKLVVGECSSCASAETQFGLVWGARADHMKNKIIPALEMGVNVITDRFDSSTYAYQIGGQKGSAGLKKLFWETREVFLGGHKPDLYIFFDIEPSLGLKRISGRAGERTHFDDKDLSFHQIVRNSFHEFLKSVPHIVIDSSKTVDEVKKDFHEAIAKILI